MGGIDFFALRGIAKPPRLWKALWFALGLAVGMSASMSIFALHARQLVSDVQTEAVETEEFIEKGESLQANDAMPVKPYIVYKVISRKGNIVVMAKVNTKYCKPSEDGKSLLYAPVVFPPKLGEPTEEDYYDHGWFFNAVEPPEPPQGQMVATVRYYVSEDNEVVADYTYEDMPPPVRVFSKLKLEDELFRRGLLDALDAFVDAQEITNEFGQKMPLRRKYETANEFSDQHPAFLQFVGAAKQVLGVDDATAEEILEASLAE